MVPPVAVAVAQTFPATETPRVDVKFNAHAHSISNAPPHLPPFPPEAEPVPPVPHPPPPPPPAHGMIFIFLLKRSDEDAV